LLLGFAGIAIAISFLFYKLALKGIKLWHLLPFIIIIILLLVWSGQISLITLLATIGVAVLMWLLYRNPTNVWELSIGSFIGWTVLMVVTSIMMPGVSYLFTWPLLFSLIPVGIYFLRENQNKYSFLQISLFLLAALPALLWLSNITYLFLVAMGLKMAGGAILFTVLCLSLLIIHIDIITRIRPWLVPIIAFSAGLFFLLYGSVNLQYNERYKKQNSLILATNGNTNETFFTSYNDKTDLWTVDYLSSEPDTSKWEDFFPWGKQDYFKNTLEIEHLPTPNLIVLNDSIFNSNRLLKFHINSGLNAETLFVGIKSVSDSIRVGINNSDLKELKRLDNTEWHLIRYYAFPEEGIDMELILSGNQDIEIILTEIVYGLPDVKGITIKQRPNDMMSAGDRTITTKKFSRLSYPGKMPSW
jgi:hypothetical protein